MVRASAVWLALLAVAAGCGTESYSDDPLTTDEAAAACVTYAACMGGYAGTCFGQILPVLDNSQSRCLAHAGKDCVRAGGCLGTTISLGGGCDPEKYSCSGSRQVACFSAATTHVDCAKVPQAGGPTCVMATTGMPMCGLEACSTSDITCVGDLLTQCVESEGVRIVAMDCAAKGMTCGTVASTATCVGAGPACTPALASCEGNVAVSCMGGQEARTDCAATLTDGTCVARDTGAICALGNECDPYQTVDTCEGDTLTYCAGGLTRTAQCSDFGFGPCQDGRCQAYQY
jgi:hypothetical protein